LKSRAEKPQTIAITAYFIHKNQTAPAKRELYFKKTNQDEVLFFSGDRKKTETEGKFRSRRVLWRKRKNDI
jgi:hypothetical protein